MPPLGPLWDGHNQLPGPRLLIAGAPVPLPPATAYGPAFWIQLSRSPRVLFGQKVNYEIRPPAVVLSPPAARLPYPERVTLAPRLRGVAESKISPPAVVANPPVALPPYSTRVTRAPRLPGVAHSAIRPPAVTQAPASTFIASPPRVTLAHPFVRSGAKAAIHPPTVVAPIPAGTPPYRSKQTLAPRLPGLAHSKVRPPVVVAAPATFTARRMLAKLATGAPGITGSRVYGIKGPAIVNPIPASVPPYEQRVTLAPRLRGVAHPKLQPPTVVNPGSTPPGTQGQVGALISLTRFRRRNSYSRIGKPAVVNSPTTAPPVVSTIAVHLTQSRKLRDADSKVKPPTVVNPIPAAVPPYSTSTSLAPRLPGVAKSKLFPPAVVTSPQQAATVPPYTARTKLAPGFKGISRTAIKPPTVTLVAPIFRPIQTKLVQQQRGLRGAKPVIHAPVVTQTPAAPFSPLLKVKLAPGYKRANVQSTIKAPVVVAPRPALDKRIGQIRLSLAPGVNPLRQTHTRIYPPRVVTPFTPPTVNVQAGTDWAPVITSW